MLPAPLGRAIPMSGLRDRISANLAGFAREGVAGAGLRPAAVALTVVEADEGPAVLLTRRASRLRDHPGQWALPGGGIDEGESVEAAARRELAEELGLDAGPGAVVGRLDDYCTRSGFCISPVVVWAGTVGPLAPNPDEVAAVHRVALSSLEAPDVLRLLTIPESDRPVIQLRLAPEQWIHAPTAAILYQFREVALAGRATRVAHFDQPVWAWG